MEIVGEQAWHAGELAMHRAMKAPTRENPNWSSLAPNAAYCLQTSAVFAAGAVDRGGRPWTSIWAGEDGFATAVRMEQAGRTLSGVAVRCLVDAQWDPVVQILRAGVGDGGAAEAKTPLGRGVKMSGLPIDLMNRNRAKLAGEVIGAVLAEHGEAKGVADMQVVLRVESSLGNCPKYLNKIPLRATLPLPELAAESGPAAAALPEEAASLLHAAPLFFLTTSNEGASLSTNHRGGAPGFLRLVDGLSANSPFPSSPHPVLVYPEYSGNRLYQSLGNLHETPKMGIAVPDFRTGSVFFATGTGRMLMGRDAARLMPRSNLVVALELQEWRLVRKSLGALATPDVAASDVAWSSAVGWSPYNPPVRPLASELPAHNPARLPTPPPDAPALGTATLVGRADLAPGISRLSFDLSLDSPRPAWTPGQYVVLDFGPELGHGYRHMDDADPAGLNDDLLRTFTVSSAPSATKFELTLRTVGRATRFLATANVRAGIELPVRAFGGEFAVPEGKDPVGFVAGGIGVTPLLAQMQLFKEQGRDVRVWWAAKAAEAGFVHAAVAGWLNDVEAEADSGSGRVDVAIFLSGQAGDAETVKVKELEALGVRVERRRIEKQDFADHAGRDLGTFYLCAGKALSKSVQTWLADMGCKVVEESFAF